MNIESIRDIRVYGKIHTVKLTPEYPSDFYDPNIELLGTYLRRLPIPKGVIVDIGANQGVVALMMQSCIPNTGIVCIEPALENIEHLKYNVPDAIIYPIGISNVNCTGSLYNGRANQCYRVDTAVTGSTIIATLDSLNLENLMLLKIDVEGHEIEVLQGAATTIEKYKPIIHLEHHWDLVDKDALYSQIEQLNYTVNYLDGNTGYSYGEINTYILTPNYN